MTKKQQEKGSYRDYKKNPLTRFELVEMFENDAFAMSTLKRLIKEDKSKLKELNTARNKCRSSIYSNNDIPTTVKPKLFTIFDLTIFQYSIQELEGSIKSRESFLLQISPIKQSKSSKFIPPQQIEKARSFPIEELIEFKRKKAVCLWHNEKTGSLTHYPKTNTAYCFGCQKSFSSIDAYMVLHNVDFKKAVRALTNK